ncbi:Asp-tRNA(Asn)/Glu-tRNA(Gln) amidotransferase subunit GatC [Rubripirellula sp.]|nr:Asp-tRNA(Asn)/Glu-tRNA(Gln) amidotransferase subunit GatC [Rubripirellula sp.]
MSAVPRTDSVNLSSLEVKKLGYLARLELTEQEVEEVRPQLAQILDFIKTLSVLDTEGVEPMTTALDVNNRWRVDELATSLSAEEALRNAPAADGEFFLVPAVLGGASTKN